MGQVIQFKQQLPKRLGTLITLVMKGHETAFLLSLPGCYGKPLSEEQVKDVYRTHAPDAYNVYFDHRQGAGR